MVHIKLYDGEAYCSEYDGSEELVELPEASYKTRSKFVEDYITCEDCKALYFEHINYIGGYDG